MRPQLGLFLGACGLALAPSLRAQIDAFAWELKGNPAGGGVQAPGSLHVVGPDSGSCAPPATWFETVMPVGAPMEVGQVFVLAGEDTSVIQILELPGILFGTDVDGGADVDGDGRLDLVASAWDDGPGGSLRVFDALDGTPKAEFHGHPLLEHFGGPPLLTGDVDGDGLADLAGLSFQPLSLQPPALVRTWTELGTDGLAASQL